MITKWKIGFKTRGSDLFDLSGLNVWETPDTQYEADPFLIKHNGENFLFYELYDHKKGVIAYSRMSNLTTVAPVICLEEDFHLSYPSIFKHNGEIYMVPEMGASSRIGLYRAVGFPDKWEVVKTIYGKPTTDNDIFFFRGVWYLFTNNYGNDNSLLILKSNDPLGNWEFHYTNEYHHSRGAGHPFIRNGKLTRPTQDGDELYGRGVVLKELQLPFYQEEIVDRIEPDIVPGIVGVHTFNYNEDWVCVDLKYKI